MKIVHITTSNRGGGAAIAAMRHSEALCRKGFDSVVLAEKGVSLAGNRAIGYGRIQRYLDAILFYFIKGLKQTGVTWSLLLFGRSIIKEKEVAEADVVILHYINEFLNYKGIDELLSSGKRVIWYMHDMWPFTGGCHHSLNCDGYTRGCEQCPQLSHCKCLAEWQLKQKKNTFMGKNLIVASPSKWLANHLYKSTLFKYSEIHICPNVIDTDVFKPLTKEEACKILNLDSKNKYILFGAASLGSIYKGLSYAYETLVKLPADYEFIVLGNLSTEDIPSQILDRMHILGFISEDEKKRIVYSAVDVFLITSIAENYPNMVVESMACGTPAVGFMTGGIVEQIEDRVTGCLAQVGDTDALVSGIKWLEQNNIDGKISRNARDFVLETCSYDNIDKLYASLLQ